jgi:MFS family permease
MPASGGGRTGLLWLSQAVSALGTSVSSLAYPLLLLDVSGSAVAAGAVGSIVAGVGLAVRVPGGALADRWPGPALLMVSDAVRAVVLGALVVAVLTGHAAIAVVLAAVALEVIAGAAFGPAEFALLRTLVRPAQRAIAVGRMQSRSQLAGMLGPTLGGALYGLHPAAPFAADATSYLLSLLMIAALRATRRPPATPGDRRSVTGAWQWLRGQRFLLAAGIWMALLTASFGAVGLAILLYARDAGATPSELGAMYTISAAGGLLGAVVTPALQRRLAPRTVFRAAAAVDLVATVSLLALHSPSAIGAVGAAAFFLAPAVAASLFGELAVRSPDELAGRAQAVMGLIVGLPAPLAPIATGAVAQLWGPLWSIVASAVAFGALGIAALLLPDSRTD